MLALLIEANRKVAYLDEVLDPENEENANIDVGEVINYIGAIDFAIDRLEKLNWIGGQGSSLKNARYIPPRTDTGFLSRRQSGERQVSIPTRIIWQFCGGERSCNL